MDIEKLKEILRLKPLQRRADSTESCIDPTKDCL